MLNIVSMDKMFHREINAIKYDLASGLENCIKKVISHTGRTFAWPNNKIVTVTIESNLDYILGIASMAMELNKKHFDFSELGYKEPKRLKVSSFKSFNKFYNHLDNVVKFAIVDSFPMDKIQTACYNVFKETPGEKFVKRRTTGYFKHKIIKFLEDSILNYYIFGSCTLPIEYSERNP